MAVTREQVDAQRGGPAAIMQALTGRGITPDSLAAKLEEELNACEVKIFWDSSSSEAKCSDPLIAWRVRQQARMDAQRLMGLYPAEKKEISGQMSMDHTVSLSALLDDIAAAQAPLVQVHRTGGDGGRRRARKKELGEDARRKSASGRRMITTPAPSTAEIRDSRRTSTTGISEGSPDSGLTGTSDPLSSGRPVSRRPRGRNRPLATDVIESESQ